MTLACVICGSEDKFELLLVKNPATNRPLAITFCCNSCKQKLTEEIMVYLNAAKTGFDVILGDEISSGNSAR